MFRFNSNDVNRDIIHQILENNEYTGWSRYEYKYYFG